MDFDSIEEKQIKLEEKILTLLSEFGMAGGPSDKMKEVLENILKEV